MDPDDDEGDAREPEGVFATYDEALSLWSDLDHKLRLAKARAAAAAIPDWPYGPGDPCEGMPRTDRGWGSDPEAVRMAEQQQLEATEDWGNSFDDLGSDRWGQILAGPDDDERDAYHERQAEAEYE